MRLPWLRADMPPSLTRIAETPRGGLYGIEILAMLCDISRLGVTQSGGSRYESGRNIPRPVQQLLRLVHVEQIDIAKIKREDFEVVEYLKASDPELFKSLKKQARASQKKGG